MKTTRVVFALGGSIPVLIGLGLFWLGARNIWRSVASRNWPRTSGVVIDSSAVAIRYQVAGRDYTTDNIRVNQSSRTSTASEAEILRLLHPSGTKLEVFYNPGDPAVAVSKPGFHADLLWLPGAGLLFLLPGVTSLMACFGSRRRPSAMGPAVACFASLFLLIGLAMLAGGGVRLWRAHASRGWPVTAGVMALNPDDLRTPAPAEDSGAAAPGVFYSARFLYRYEVDGKPYFGNNPRFGLPPSDSVSPTGELAGRFPPGAKIKVTYSPEDPEISVLEPGIYPDIWWLPGAGLVFLLFGLLVILVIVPRIDKHPF